MPYPLFLRAASVLAGASLLLRAAPPAPQCAPSDLQQNWNIQEKTLFWFTSQGSQIMPYAWFLALETPWNEMPFRDRHVMDDLLGFIAAGPSSANPDGLPVGFARAVGQDGNAQVGLTCAACHTGRLEIAGVPALVEGGPALIDYETFVSWLVDALEATLADGPKFARFARGVLGPAGAADPARAARLRLQLSTQKDELWARRNRNYHAEPYGYARVDAFGHILNELLVKDLGIPANQRPPNAPVSYPFLWDTPHHDRVQWNGSAPNRKSFGLGPLLRNIGEVVGVFGKVRLTPASGKLPAYRSSVDKQGLRKLEGLLGSLHSPVWPANCLPLDAAKAERGRQAYSQHCQGCHPLLNRADPDRRIVARLVPLSDIGTDPTMATNFATRSAATGRLQGTPLRFPVPFVGSFVGNFRAEASGAQILGNAVLGIYFGQLMQLSESAAPPPTGPERSSQMESEAEAILDGLDEKSPRYKARPLNGIWATAPYLHNGSVPNLRELLTRPDDRVKQFFVGSRRFDPVNVGLSVERDSHRGFLLDTTRPGNRNTGHSFGTALDAADRDALIEYLKQL